MAVGFILPGAPFNFKWFWSQREPRGECNQGTVARKEGGVCVIYLITSREPRESLTLSDSSVARKKWLTFLRSIFLFNFQVNTWAGGIPRALGQLKFLKGRRETAANFVPSSFREIFILTFRSGIGNQAWNINELGKIIIGLPGCRSAVSNFASAVIEFNIRVIEAAPRRRRSSDRKQKIEFRPSLSVYHWT